MPTLPISKESDQIIKEIKKAVGGFKRTRIVEESQHYIHFTFRSAIFRFVDDVEFEIDSEERVLHFRSASRTGRSDLGVNRRRMEKLVQKLKGRV